MFVSKDSEDEQRYKCSFHARQSNISTTNNDSSYHQTPAIINNRRPFNKRTNSLVETTIDGDGNNYQRPVEIRSICDEDLRGTQPVVSTRSTRRTTWTGDRDVRNMPVPSRVETRKLLRRTADRRTEKSSRQPSQQLTPVRSNADLEMTESVWITRESLRCTAAEGEEKDSMRIRQQQQQGPAPLYQNSYRTNDENCSEHFRKKLLPIDDDDDKATTGELHRSGDCFSARLQQQQQQPPDPGGCCNKAVAMTARKRAIAEWQVMAAIVDRLLFWIFLLATVFTYLVILVGVPLMKSETGEFIPLSNEHLVDDYSSSRLATTSQGQIDHNE